MQFIMNMIMARVLVVILMVISLTFLFSMKMGNVLVSTQHIENQLEKIHVVCQTRHFLLKNVKYSKL
ncbi:hypothetical protein C2G38_2081560 [Gigaspora rosea]|uniref:Uncharacterized protein n=1 Tax=Gigaspora rosea TaxID=44941 RepID=A0A397VE87_9GLOM|nr:hypothetical protein C2G38_2081560 [Gigaspora rosea]